MRPERNQGRELVYAILATCCCGNAGHPETVAEGERMPVALPADMHANCLAFTRNEE